MHISKYRRGPRAGAALPIDFTMSREDYRRWTQLLFHGMHMGVRHPPGITFTGGVRVRLHVGVVANNGLFQVSVKSLCLWGRLGLITRALGISIRPDPELALALAQPADAGASAREGVATVAAAAATTAVRLPPDTTDTPWDLPEAGDSW